MTLNVAHAHDDPRHPGEHKGEDPENVPNEGTRHELLAAVLHRRASRADGDCAHGRYLCKSSPVDPLAGFHVSVRK